MPSPRPDIGDHIISPANLTNDPDAKSYFDLRRIDRSTEAAMKQYYTNLIIVLATYGAAYEAAYGADAKNPEAAVAEHGADAKNPEAAVAEHGADAKYPDEYKICNTGLPTIILNMTELYLFDINLEYMAFSKQETESLVETIKKNHRGENLVDHFNNHIKPNAEGKRTTANFTNKLRKYIRTGRRFIEDVISNQRLSTMLNSTNQFPEKKVYLVSGTIGGESDTASGKIFTDIAFHFKSAQEIIQYSQMSDEAPAENNHTEEGTEEGISKSEIARSFIKILRRRDRAAESAIREYADSGWIGGLATFCAAVFALTGCGITVMASIMASTSLPLWLIVIGGSFVTYNNVTVAFPTMRKVFQDIFFGRFDGDFGQGITNFYHKINGQRKSLTWPQFCGFVGMSLLGLTASLLVGFMEQDFLGNQLPKILTGYSFTSFGTILPLLAPTAGMLVLAFIAKALGFNDNFNFLLKLAICAAAGTACVWLVSLAAPVPFIMTWIYPIIVWSCTAITFAVFQGFMIDASAAMFQNHGDALGNVDETPWYTPILNFFNVKEQCIGLYQTIMNQLKDIHRGEAISDARYTREAALTTALVVIMSIASVSGVGFLAYTGYLSLTTFWSQPAALVLIVGWIAPTLGQAKFYLNGMRNLTTKLSVLLCRGFAWLANLSSNSTVTVNPAAVNVKPVELNQLTFNPKLETTPAEQTDRGLSFYTEQFAFAANAIMNGLLTYGAIKNIAASLVNFISRATGGFLTISTGYMAVFGLTAVTANSRGITEVGQASATQIATAAAHEDNRLLDAVKRFVVLNKEKSPPSEEPPSAYRNLGLYGEFFKHSAVLNDDPGTELEDNPTAKAEAEASGVGIGAQA